MNILAIDTSGPACSAAVRRAGIQVFARRREMARGHAEHLAPMIEEALHESELVAADVDVVAVTVGPGSFTGLRIGLAAARGLVLALGESTQSARPILYGVSCFDVVAHEADRIGCQGRPLVIALESKRADLYVRYHAADGSPIGQPGTARPENLILEIDRPVAIAGDACGRVVAALVAAGRAPEEAIAIDVGGMDATTVALLAEIGMAAGRSGEPPEPVYLRAPDVTAPSPRVLGGKAAP